VNVRRFIEDLAATSGTTATISGLSVKNVSAVGFSRAFARIQYDSHGLRFQDVVGDSHGQDGDPFAQGVDLRDTVHDAEFKNVTMANAISTYGRYWDGDGFSAEPGTYDIHLEDTRASGNTDAGYDLMSRSATLINVTADDNKRNFRVWGAITVKGCTGTNPRQRGGAGTQAQVQATNGATARFERCRFSDDDPHTIVFDLDETADLTVSNSTVHHAGAGRLHTVAAEARLRTDALAVE
jgi:hypothetical protein